MPTDTADEGESRRGRIQLLRRVVSRGAAHPIQVSVVRQTPLPRDDGTAGVSGFRDQVVFKVLLRCDGHVRDLRVPPGRYALRAREVPLGCNVQGQELIVDVDDVEPVCVLLRVGTYLQVYLAGFGGCLLPPSRHGTKAFYFDHVSPEAFAHELKGIPDQLKELAKRYGNNQHINSNNNHAHAASASASA